MIDSQIDPVTGLPISGDLGIIQQIPLGKQMFDWESYDATARMVRPPLYGDDVLPTVTNVQGQHPDTGSAQSIESDGNHRLKVAATLDGGGGSAPVNMIDHTWDDDKPVYSGGRLRFDFGTRFTTIYGWIDESMADMIGIANSDANDSYLLITGHGAPDTGPWQLVYQYMQPLISTTHSIYVPHTHTKEMLPIPVKVNADVLAYAGGALDLVWGGHDNNYYRFSHLWTD